MHQFYRREDSSPGSLGMSSRRVSSASRCCRRARPPGDTARECAMTRPESRLMAEACAWREADPDPETRADLDQLLGTTSTDTDAGAGVGTVAAAELAERFTGALAFGTAGIRAAMGAGPMRMNRLVAGRVAAGLARYIAARDPAAAAAGGVVGYDGPA